MPRYFSGVDYIVTDIGACGYNTGALTWAFALRKEIDSNAGIEYLAGVAPAYAAACGWEAGGTTITDDFTGGPQLTYTYIEGPGAPEYFGNQVDMGSGHVTVARVSARASNVLPSANHEASIYYVSWDPFVAAENYGGVWVRLDASAVTGYVAQVETGSGFSSANVSLQKAVAGSYSTLAFVTDQGTNWGGSTALTEGHQIKLRAVDESGSVRLRVYLDGLEIINYLDSSSPITGNVRVGWVGRGTDSSVFAIMDGFVASTIAGGTTTQYLLDSTGGKSSSTASEALPANEWGILVYRKAAGNGVNASLSTYRFNTNTWSHGTGTGTVSDGATANSNVVFGAHPTTDEAFQGHLDIAAFWKARLSDLQIESLVSLSSWTSLNPIGRWRFDQLDVNTPVPDLTGNGANEIGHSGTSVSGLTSPFVSTVSGSTVFPHPARRRLPLHAR